ncbi:MAG: neutral/alkaline non-lysosomal ceramidase N-terminal domain-containing protein [Verrucomicrobia bacterium]|nr:neutral/alkaline non-lysosomal ceramidase N-terminal domain-containing protein [Verrucomicrobiota bacterium]
MAHSDFIKAGVAQTDITPPTGTPLAGSCVLRASVRVLDRLHAKALVLEQDERRYAIVTADLLGFDERMIARLRRFCAKHLHIGFLLCNASHAHSGPDAYNEFQTYTDRKPLAARRRYQHRLERKLRRLIAGASRHLKRVSMTHGAGRAFFGVNRRRKFDGAWQMMPNPKGFHDKTVTVFQFSAASGRPLAVLFSYACHPTTRYANEVSADYPGVAQRIIEKRTGAMALFVQGAGGDIRPNVTKPGSRPRRFRTGTQADVDCYGRELGAEVLRILRGRMQSLKPNLDARKTVVKLLFDRLPTETQLREIQKESKDYEVRRVWAEKMFRWLKRDGFEKGLPTEMQLLRLSDDHAILAVSHELCNGYVPIFQRMDRDTTMTVLGYTNACRGYIPTRKVCLEGGYEGKTSICGFGLPAPFRPTVENDLARACRQLMS